MSTPKLTIKQVKAELRKYQMTLRRFSTTDEYLVKRQEDKSTGGGYYTDDLSDALTTGMDMRKRYLL